MSSNMPFLSSLVARVFNSEPEQNSVQICISSLYQNAFVCKCTSVYSTVQRWDTDVFMHDIVASSHRRPHLDASHALAAADSRLIDIMK